MSDQRPLFLPLTQNVSDPHGVSHRVAIFAINADSPIHDVRAEDQLFDAVDRQVRMQDLEVIVDVQLPIVPQFVLAAIKRFAHTGDPIVAIHRRQCSLDSGYRAPHALFDAARQAAGRNGMLWHPLKLTFVPRNPLPGV